MILARVRGPLLEVGSGKSLTRRSSSCLGLGVPADVHQEPDHALALLHVLLLDSAQQAASPTRAEPGWCRPGPPRSHRRLETRAMCGPISMIACSIRMGLFEPRADVLERPAAALVPRAGLHADDLLGHGCRRARSSAASVGTSRRSGTRCWPRSARSWSRARPRASGRRRCRPVYCLGRGRPGRDRRSHFS